MSGLLLGIRAELDPSDDDQTVAADNVEILCTTFDDDNTSVEQRVVRLNYQETQLILFQSKELETTRRGNSVINNVVWN